MSNDWLDKFEPGPRTASEFVDGTALPGGEKDNMQTTEAILGYNNGMSIFKTSGVYTVEAKGVTINKITEAQAEAISTRVKQCAQDFGEPLTYVLACLAIESTFDPACENGNFAGSNPTKDPGGYDMGIAQLKVKYLPDDIGDNDAKKAYALDIERAIPYHCKSMVQRIAWAENIIDQHQANPSSDSSPDPRMLDQYILATNAYNYGDTGVMEYFNNGTFPSHGQHVLDLERMFAKNLGIASIFPTNF